MFSFLKLIRWPNLLLIVVSMKLLLFFVISPALGLDWFEGGMDVWEFTLLVAATLFLAMGGYLINDFFDMNADSVNKPGKNLVGGKFSVFTTNTLYWVFTLSGVLLGSWFSYLLNQINYALIFLFVAGLLWFYSQKYQCQPLVGNVVVAVLSALSFGLVWLFEFFALSNQAQIFTEVQANFHLVNRLVLIYMGFAFLVSLLREVVKDIEDFAGDDRFGCRTFAVVYGKNKAQKLALGIALAGLLAAFWFQYYFFTASFFFLFAFFFVIDAMFVVAILRLLQAKEKSDYAKLSNLIKLLMLAGVLSMVLFYFEF
ncbi:MAG: geranylgeranylglycerol-phosphate geranylgeranyltransferase [Bacteroidales bacterium]|nr:geranylgeranylglycerol-phosphate geranylgeranyltransferase [Bacteroidales bacterium]